VLLATPDSTTHPSQIEPTDGCGAVNPAELGSPSDHHQMPFGQSVLLAVVGVASEYLPETWVRSTPIATADDVLIVRQSIPSSSGSSRYLPAMSTLMGTSGPNLRRTVLFEEILSNRCDVLPVSEPIARHAGRLRGGLRAHGKPRTQADMLIAAMEAIHGLTLVTRNTRDFEGIGITVFDPFQGAVDDATVEAELGQKGSRAHPLPGAASSLS